jgi:TonB family protein
MITYLLQETFILAFFYLFYQLVLSKETFFQTNRVYLIASLLVSIVLPLIRIYIENFHVHPVIFSQTYQSVGSYIDAVGTPVLVSTKVRTISWQFIFTAIYIMGAIVLMVRMLRQIDQIFRIKRKGEKTMILNHECVLSDEVQSPFSFFSTIYLPLSHSFSDMEIQEIISHEKAHVSGRHTIDILLMELACIILWPVPVIYLYRKKLREVHEFLADAEVIKNTPWENYASFLVAQKGSSLQNHLSNQMFYSQLKNRLQMMTQRPSAPRSKFKYLGLIPVVLISLVFFSFKERTGYFADETGSIAMDTFPATYITAYRLTSPLSDSNEIENISALEVYEDMAIFPGCENVPINQRGNCSNTNLSGFISQHLVYPASLKESGIEGKVIVKFTVGIDGFVKNSSVQKSFTQVADQAALDVVNHMNEKAGRWMPARKEGKAMEAEMWLPISFTLGNNDVNVSEQREVFSVVEEMPRFPGCEHLNEAERSSCATDKMFQYIYQSILYPKEDREQGNEGMVVAKFTVDVDGSIIDAKVVRGASPGMNAEILRVINGMNDLPQKWIPGMHDGLAVPVEIALPFKFVLQAESTNPGQSAHIETPNIQNPSTAKFQILIESSNNEFKLYCKEGCAWKGLEFNLQNDQAQAIDQFGMTGLNNKRNSNDGNLPDFLITIMKTQNGVSFEGKEGTAWIKLGFDCPSDHCSQFINEYGMMDKD